MLRVERFRIHSHNTLQFAKSINLIETTFLATNPQSHNSRSLLQWSGDLLKSLFGTAAKNDLPRLRQDLVRLGSSHNQLVYEVENM